MTAQLISIFDPKGKPVAAFSMFDRKRARDRLRAAFAEIMGRKWNELWRDGYRCRRAPYSVEKQR